MGKKKHKKKKTASGGKQSISYKQTIIVKCHKELNHEAIHRIQEETQSFFENWSKSKRANFSQKLQQLLNGQMMKG